MGGHDDQVGLGNMVRTSLTPRHGLAGRSYEALDSEHALSRTCSRLLTICKYCNGQENGGSGLQSQRAPTRRIPCCLLARLDKAIRAGESHFYNRPIIETWPEP